MRDEQSSHATRPAEPMHSPEAVGIVMNLLQHLPAGLAFIDTDFRFQLINDALAAINGLPRADHLGRTVAEVLPQLWPILEPVFRRVFDSGEPVLGVESEGELAPGQTRQWVGHYYPITEEDGRIAGLGALVFEITARKKTEAALRHQELLYRSLIDASAQTVWTADPEGHAITRVPAGVELIGDGEMRHDRRQMTDLMHPDDRATAFAAWLEGIAGGRPFEFQHRIYDAAGTERSVLNRVVPVRNADGQIVEWVGTTEDITARVGAEAHLRIRLRQQEAVARLGHFAITSADIAALMEQAVTVVADILNNEFASILQLDDEGSWLTLVAAVGWPTEPVGKLRVRVTPDTQAGYTLLHGGPVILDNLHQELRFTGAPQLRDYGVKSGMTVVIPGPLKPFGVFSTHSKQGRVFTSDDTTFLQGVGNILASFVERRRLEVVATKQAHFTATLMETLPGVVIVVDAEHGIVQWNRGLERITGFTADEIHGRAPIELFVQPDRAEVATCISTVLDVGHSSIEARLRTKTGSDIPYFFSGVRLRSETATLFLSVGVDISERKRWEQRFMQAQKMEAFGQLAGGVAHDFNNLLTIINGYSDYVLTHLDEGHEMREPLQEIIAAGERASTLTRQLLAFSRQQIAERKVIDVNEVIAGTEKMLRRILGEDVLLSSTLEDGRLLVLGDSNQLQQLLLNLVVNARDAMPTGGTLTIETRRMSQPAHAQGRDPEIPRGDYVALTISDSGEGMDEQVRTRVFEPFFTTKGPGKGTGLGLATVHGIVQQMNGHITVASARGRGTTFRIFLPQAAGAAGQPARPPSGARVMPAGTETLLLAEDEEPVRALAAQILRSCGYTVLEAPNGAVALERAAAFDGTIHLLVSDVVMPLLGGRELAERMVALRPGCKVLFLSGYTDDAVLRHGVLEAEFAFLQKPFTPPVLAQKVRAVLDATG